MIKPIVVCVLLFAALGVVAGLVFNREKMEVPGGGSPVMYFATEEGNRVNSEIKSSVFLFAVGGIAVGAIVGAIVGTSASKKG